MAFNSYMHERNIYRNQPDFTQIALDFPLFRKYAVPDAKGKKVRVDFSNPDALRMVTQILLKKDFKLDVEIPHGFLIPTIPQRLNYILWLEDLLCNVPKEKNVISGIDIGTGPCAIFSILGARKNNWNFIATESSDDAIYWAKKNVEKNNLDHNIKIVKVSPGTTLSEILSSNEETYDFCLCNPPFFGDNEEIRKKHPDSETTIADLAQEEEIFFQGGELNFVKNILSDSLIYKDRICLFTSMCGKKKSFLHILKGVKEIKDAKVTTTEFCQGNTIRWGIAWTFNKSLQFEEVKRKIKPKKAKPPLEYYIPLKESKDFNLHNLLGQMETFLKSLQIPVTVTRSSQYFAELLLKSDKNTWTHQRRKRREMERQKKETDDLKKHPDALSDISHNQVTISNSEIISEKNICSTVDTITSEMNIDGSSASESISFCRNVDGDSEHSKQNAGKISPKKQKLNNPDNLSLGVDLHNKKSLDVETTNDIVCDKVPELSLLTTENTALSSCEDEISKKESEDDQDIFQNNRKYLNQTNMPINKKFKPDIKEKNSEFYSELCTNMPLESSEMKAGHYLETTDIITKKESDTEQSRTNIKICDKNEIKDSSGIFSAGNVENFEPESSVLLEESIPIKQTINSSIKDHDKEQSFIKTENKSIPCENKSNIASSSTLPQSCKQNTIFSGKNGADCKEKKDSSSEQSCILNCHLQLIKGKAKIYVKMNCSPTADRNAMYQVFQLIKNKIK